MEVVVEAVRRVGFIRGPLQDVMVFIPPLLFGSFDCCRTRYGMGSVGERSQKGPSFVFVVNVNGESSSRILAVVARRRVLRYRAFYVRESWMSREVMNNGSKRPKTVSVLLFDVKIYMQMNI